MTVKLPEAIEAYFAADRNGGPDALAACFTPGARVTDMGETFLGEAAIRQWKLGTSGKYGPLTITPASLGAAGGRTQVVAEIAGNFPGSPVRLTYDFALSGDRIAELAITL